MGIGDHHAPVRACTTGDFRDARRGGVEFLSPTAHDAPFATDPRETAADRREGGWA